MGKIIAKMHKLYIVAAIVIIALAAGATAVTARTAPTPPGQEAGQTEITVLNTDQITIEIDLNGNYPEIPLTYVSLVSSPAAAAAPIELSSTMFGRKTILITVRLSEPWTGTITVNWLVVPR